MNDILERLRYRLDHGGPGTPCITGYSDPGTPLEQDVQEAADEIERLRGDLATMYRLHRERGALADDLYDQLDNNVQAAIDVESMNAAKARYREVTQR